MRYFRAVPAILALAGACAAAFSAPAAAPRHAPSAGDAATAPSKPSSAPVVSAAPPIIVIGLLGGWIRTDNRDDHIVQLAEQLNRQYGPGVRADVFENHHRQQACDRILALLDLDGDGSLEPDEIRNARIVLFGESWGASETITLARQLQQRGIPVLLTVQIDSVAKPGQNDEVAPANVAQAVNFYQTDGILHGRRQIRAEDASRTEILGNFRFDYRKHPVAARGASWFARTFFRPHVSIENDPAVWTRIESLIRAKLPAPAARQLAATNAP